MMKHRTSSVHHRRLPSVILISTGDSVLLIRCRFPHRGRKSRMSRTLSLGSASNVPRIKVRCATTLVTQTLRRDRSCLPNVLRRRPDRNLPRPSLGWTSNEQQYSSTLFSSTSPSSRPSRRPYPILRPSSEIHKPAYTNFGHAAADSPRYRTHWAPSSRSQHCKPSQRRDCPILSPSLRARRFVVAESITTRSCQVGLQVPRAVDQASKLQCVPSPLCTLLPAVAGVSCHPTTTW